MPVRKKRSKKRESADVHHQSKPEKAPRFDLSPAAGSLEGRYVYARDINRLLSACSLVIIRGPIASGKTYSAMEAARLAGTAVESIHVNEDFDVKTLFGAYKCTDIPGEFVWTPSDFAKHLENDCYILLEELDAGSPDLVAALLTLCEKREYTLQNGERRALHGKCRILATVVSGRESNLNLIRDYPFFVDIPPLTNDELAAICAATFPAMESVRERSLEIFDSVRKFVSSKCASDRQLNAKDFFRLCGRFHSGEVDFSLNLAILQEMYDVWVAHIADRSRRLEAGELIGANLSLAAEQIRTLLNVRKPDISANGESLLVGRASLSRRRTTLQRTRSLGMTRDCCQLLERLARAVSSREPVLLTGETGVGKTSVVQLLADYCGVELRTVNMSQDSEFCDLIGGFKPTPIINLVRPLTEKYLQLFRATLNATRNAKFLSFVENSLANERIEDLLKLIIESSERTAGLASERSADWSNMASIAKRLLQYVQNSTCAFPFTYVAGVVTRAAEAGDWLLVDEINLSPPECLDAIMQVVDEKTTRVHPNFRLFACMNPATDVGKRYLSVNVRLRFVEFFVGEPTEREELDIIVRNYLPQVEYAQLDNIWKFYQATHELFPRKYSLRTLCRALKIIASNANGNVKKQIGLLSLAFSISFTSNLDSDEQKKLSAAIQKHFGKPKSLTNVPSGATKKEFVEVEGFFIKRGDLQPTTDPHFIFTPSVRTNLSFLASVVANGEFPILLEGETSAGKTSMIQYLAKVTGNRIHRINNHEHTDVQEYIGSYAPNPSGHIEFVEGVLLRAVRKGEWIILDELNLAPSIVLEALNRLLDDNREIFVAELNETVVAHPRFRLFATQNPAGHYAGRKRLSAAFLNRFVILRYEHLPFAELPSIVEGRCGIAPSMAAKMVEVLVELRSRRSVYGIFSYSSGLMTLRDLFRWATRVARTVTSSDTNFDWRQVAADQGFFVLASRCRNSEDEQLVVGVLESKLSRKIDSEALFAADFKYMPYLGSSHNSNMPSIVMTYSMRRMAVLCSEAWKFNEAVLLVGETGCGKTTVVHLLDEPLSINCHERTETSDFLGSIRPVADGKFQWHDGIVVRAMKAGRKLLVDEISLAPDSVLERLNSLLETDRSILLTDGGSLETDTIVAHSDFQFVGTMNPGDDHGKKELSKALRNRFLEVWCIGERNPNDLRAIVRRRLDLSSVFASAENCDLMEQLSSALVEFFEYFRQHTQRIFTMPMTIRDLINIVELLSGCFRRGLTPSDAIFQAISATFFDAFGVIPARISYNAQELIAECIQELNNILANNKLEVIASKSLDMTIRFADDGLYVGSFFVECGSELPQTSSFSFDAPTAQHNLFCVARGMASTKPIMLEGSPGAGKSSLIVALAEATGHSLVRLNLSEQTDLSDLFGGDVPHTTSDGMTTFVWRDGPVLKAIKDGSWVLLDEMNLASQSVLEGLNSCFDFRKNLYISELNKTFEIESSNSRFFACQNPRSQGGDRKALPKSFINRFTSIYVSEMSDADFLYILRKRCAGQFDDELLSRMVAVNHCISLISLREGGPFEFNLRDLLRWASIINKCGLRFGYELVYTSRLRNEKDIAKFAETFDRFFPDVSDNTFNKISIGSSQICAGHDSISYASDFFNDVVNARQFASVSHQANVLRRLAACVDMNWLSLLVGDFSSCLRLCVEMLSALAGRRLHILRLTAETDSLELLGSYEQVSASHSGEAGKTTFQWIDSEFVNAYRDGHWILVQDVNCCSSAVLDCLNCCLEDGGKLVLPEHGANDSANVIEKHPEFRVFFTMDPLNGTLSRAMRNRSVEIFVGSGAFWNNTLEAHFDFPSYRARKEVLNWIASVSFGSAWRETARICQNNTDSDLRLRVNSSCKALMSAEKISAVFSDMTPTSGVSFAQALARYAVCYPFANEDEHQSFLKRDVMEVMEIASPSDDSLFKSTFCRMFAAMYALLGRDISLRKISTDFDYHSISWVDSNSADVFLASQALNTRLDPSTTHSLNLQSWLSGSCLTKLANRFWTEFGCSTSPERSHLHDLNSSSTDVKWILHSYWKLLFTEADVRSRLRGKLHVIGNHFDVRHLELCAEYSLSELFKFLGTSVAFLAAMTPSHNDEDVSVRLSEDLNRRRDLDKLRIIEKFFDCVKRFLVTVVGTYDSSFIDNMKLPILRSLWKLRHGATAADDAFDLSAFLVFRPTAQSFQNLARTLVDFKSSVLQFELSVLNGPLATDFRDGKHLSTSELLRLSSQIESFLTSTGFFTRTVFSKFSAFTDVILPYSAVLNVIILELNILNRQVLRAYNAVELTHKHQFPLVPHLFSVQSGLEAVIGWCLGEKSPLPARYQYQLVQWQILKREKTDGWTNDLEWVFRNWCKRHEKSVTRASQSFVYKSRAAPQDDGNNAENGILDEYRLEFDYYFPNYSNETLDDVGDEEAKEETKAKYVPSDNIITDEELVELIGSIVNSQPQTHSSAIPYFPLMKLMEYIDLDLSREDEAVLKYHHLVYMSRIERFTPSSNNASAKKRALDVYTENDYAEVMRCVAAIDRLKRRVSVLHDEYPENQVLFGILHAISAYLALPPTTPLMRLTSLLEKLLVEADEWQQLADRTHSIRDETLALQQILVDWRRLEVLCWADIVERIQREFRGSSLICAYPIFDTFQSLFLNKHAESSVDEESKILLMLMEWIQNATLVDFETRLFTGSLLARFVEIRGGLTSLASRIRSLVKYFRIFSATISERFSASKTDMEENLKEFVEIFKYNDLNLWSVKQSTQKVHGQLFRIIKKFKEACKEPVLNILLHDTLPIPAIQPTKSIPIELDAAFNSELSAKFDIFTGNFDNLLSKIFDVNVFKELSESSAEFFTTLQTDIVYSGSDEEKQKQHGRALNHRQKQFAYLLRGLDDIGVCGRRGLNVGSEGLTVRVISGAQLDLAKSHTAEQESDDASALLTRLCGASRNVFRKKFAAFRLAMQDKISKQVPVRRLSGMTEYGLYWIANTCEAIGSLVRVYSDEFAKFSADFNILVENAQSDVVLQHSLLSTNFVENEAQLWKIQSSLTLLLDVLNASPSDATDEKIVDANLARLASEISTSPLINMTKSSPKYQNLASAISSSIETAQRIQSRQKSIFTSPSGFRKSEEVATFKSFALGELDGLYRLLSHDVSPYFPNECVELERLCLELIQRIGYELIVDVHNGKQPAEFDYETDVRLKMQEVYDRLRSVENSAVPLKALDVMDKVVKLLARADLKSVVEIFNSFLDSLRNSYASLSSDTLRTAHVLCVGFYNFLNVLADRTSGALQEFSICYLHFENIAIHLISNGFVNDVPRAEDGEGSGEAKEGNASSGENCGMGDAKDGESAAPDAKDVAEQLEETGQLEGLKGEEENKQQENGEKPQDSENPVEMEDDFAAGLEDLDGEDLDEDDAGGDDDNGPEMEDKLDWEKGDVDEPEERQLDPELWDKPQDAPEPESVDEDDAKGADKETDEVVAKDDNSAVVEKKQDQETGENQPDENQDATIDDDDQPDEPFSGLDNQDDEDQGGEDGEVDEKDKDAESTDEQPNDEEMDVDQDGGEEAKDDANSVQNNVDENSIADQSTVTEGIEKGVGEAEKDDQEDASGTRNEEAEDQEGANDECEKKSRRRDKLGREKNSDKEDKNPREKDDKKAKSDDRRAERDENAEIAARDDELDRIDDSAVPPRQMGDDEVEIAEEMDENGEEAFAANRDENEHLPAKHIVQKSTVEEAERTRELYQRFDRTGERFHHADQVETVEEKTADENDIEIRQFERHKSQDDDVIFISEHIRQMGPLADALPAATGVEDESVPKEMDVDHAQSMELRWSNITGSVAQLASMLAENLRIIIEPTVASRLQGDYRTGKRLNVRRLISYVASDYRKDRIWMRRTKKVKRNYHIAIAVDDSASMKDNQMSTITCHSLCLIEKALRQLEVGKLMLCKFGADVKVLSDFCADASADATLGARLMSELTFAQERTNLSNLLTVAGKKFSEAVATQSGTPADQMLIILSDGRGVMTEGVERIRQALKRLDMENVTVLFIIIDNGAEGKSILDVKVVTGYERNEKGVLKANCRSYMELFPFPFYVIVNGVEQLPTAISNAIQQWFEFTTR